MKFGYDDNIGIPDGFAKQIGYQTASYHQLDEMLTALEQEELASCFAPAGVLPYLSSTHQIIAQATMGPEHTKTEKSIYVVSKDTHATDPQTLSGLCHGRVNKYCTTRYRAQGSVSWIRHE